MVGLINRWVIYVLMWAFIGALPCLVPKTAGAKERSLYHRRLSLGRWSERLYVSTPRGQAFTTRDLRPHWLALWNTLVEASAVNYNEGESTPNGASPSEGSSVPVLLPAVPQNLQPAQNTPPAERLSVERVAMIPLAANRLPSPLTAGLPRELAFMEDFVVFMRDFIDRFQGYNDRSFINMDNFRSSFTQALWGAQGGRLRVDLEIEAMRQYRLSGTFFSFDAGGAGGRVQYDFATRQRNDGSTQSVGTVQLTVMPVYGEIRTLLFAGTNIDRDILVRSNIAGLLSIKPWERVEAGVVVAFQPQWIDFGSYRSLQEIYARIRILDHPSGNALFYVDELVFVPRIVHWGLTDPPVAVSFGEQADAGRAGFSIREQVARFLPEFLFPPNSEVVLMGNLGFRFSL